VTADALRPTDALHPAVASAVAPDALAAAALSHYDLSPAAEPSLLSISENATYRVDDPATGRRTVLRVHRRGYHTRQAIVSELAWLRALREAGAVRTPGIVRTHAGGDIVGLPEPGGGERHAVMFEWVSGIEPTGERPAEFAELGAVTARLHRHARQWRPPPGFTRFTWDWDTALGESGHWGRWRDGLAVGPAEDALFERTAQVLRRRLARFGNGPDRFGLIHADLRLANLLIDDDGGDGDGDGERNGDLHVIDFDDCGFSWYLYDLGASLSFIEHRPEVPELIGAWVDGYRTEGELPAEQEAELPTFVMLRRLLLVAWIGSHAETEQARLMGPQYTADSCDLAERYLSRFA
jgi:Ser/Thr protein kinase RdoA (MazF antagonist)